MIDPLFRIDVRIILGSQVTSHYAEAPNRDNAVNTALGFVPADVVDTLRVQMNKDRPWWWGPPSAFAVSADGSQVTLTQRKVNDLVPVTDS